MTTIDFYNSNCWLSIETLDIASLSKSQFSFLTGSLATLALRRIKLNLIDNANLVLSLIKTSCIGYLLANKLSYQCAVSSILIVSFPLLLGRADCIINISKLFEAKFLVWFYQFIWLILTARQPTKRLGNRVYGLFIFKFLCCCFLKFYFHTVLSNLNSFQTTLIDP